MPLQPTSSNDVPRKFLQISTWVSASPLISCLISNTKKLEGEHSQVAPIDSASAAHAALTEGRKAVKWLNIVTLLLLVIGGLNWGAVALGGHEMDFVANLFGGDEAGAARLVYALVGLSALWQLMPWFKSLTVGEVSAESGRHHAPTH
jgi:uncharacterized protein